jgi:hypothetical protein
MALVSSGNSAPESFLHQTQGSDMSTKGEGKEMCAYFSSYRPVYGSVVEIYNHITCTENIYRICQIYRDTNLCHQDAEENCRVTIRDRSGKEIRIVWPRDDNIQLRQATIDFLSAWRKSRDDCGNGQSSGKYLP